MKRHEVDDADPAQVYRFLDERRRQLAAEDDGMTWEISGGMLHGSLRQSDEPKDEPSIEEILDEVMESDAEILQYLKENGD